MNIKSASLTLSQYKWVTQQLKRLRDKLPHRCLLCFQQTRHFDDHLCDCCRADLPYPQYICLGCAKPLTIESVLCGRCHIEPPQHLLITASNYLSPIKELISSLKYRGNKLAAFELARHLSVRVQRAITQGDIEQPQLLVPVPLHRRRLISRGFNQAELIATHLGQILNIPVADSCQRRIATSAQAQLNAQQRRHNLDGAFKLVSPITVSRIAIIDDVYTTGATINELSKEIKQQYQIDIQYWCIARTLI
jgi:ComF family protein